MCSAFSALDEAYLAPTTEEAFGEDMEFLPKRAAAYAVNAADPDRPRLSIRATVFSSSAARRSSSDRSLADRGDVAAPGVEVHVSRRYFRGGLPKQGDILNWNNRQLSIALVQPDETDHIVLKCHEVSL